MQAARVSLHGTPWYLNDLIETRVVGQARVSNIYFMVLGDHGQPGPGHGVTGIIPEPKAGTMFERRATQETGGSTIFVDWTWPAGIAMGSKSALSILQDAAVL